MNEKSAGQGRLGIIIGGILVLVVAVAAVLATTRPPTQFDPDTPEGAVQAYLQAVEDKDWDKAHGLLSASLRKKCKIEDMGTVDESVSRAVIEDVREVGTITRVEVRITHVYLNDPLSPSSYDSVETFDLETEDGRWVIAELVWPYFFCSR
jgi:hypothetical protein